MTILEPFFREAGSGPGVVCLHANASTSGQWRGLMERLAPQFHVLAPDSYDSGKGPRWPSARVIHLRDEVALIEPVLTRAGSPLALVTPSAHGVARLLVNALPQVQCVEFESLGHMGPITNPDLVNEAIGQFLERTEDATSAADGLGSWRASA